jgi:hypothetical protein
MGSRRMRHRIRVVAALSPADWTTLAEAWLRLLWVDLALRFLPYAWCRRALRRGLGPAVEVGGSAERAARVVRLVDVAARHHVRAMTCLRRALVLQRMLERRGIAAVLRVGARRDEGFLAHAWVEVDGRPVGEPGGPDGSYRAFEGLGLALDRTVARPHGRS